MGERDARPPGFQNLSPGAEVEFEVTAGIPEMEDAHSALESGESDQEKRKEPVLARGRTLRRRSVRLRELHRLSGV